MEVDSDACRLTATAALAQTRSGHLTIEAHARSLLQRIDSRDADVAAWAHLDRQYVLRQARDLDSVAPSERGPLHGVPIAIKDIVYTQGKTVTTEFAATTTGVKTRNPHNAAHTPGGSSSGSAAAVADFQAPLSVGTQTGGSVVRPASFCGVYGFKPTWSAISREGIKVSSLTLDTVGFFARCTDDLDLLADVFRLRDDEPPPQQEAPGASCAFRAIEGARFAICKTPAWPAAGPGTRAALARAAELLRKHGAVVEAVDLSASFREVPRCHSVILHAEAQAVFLPEHLRQGGALAPELREFARGEKGYTRSDLVSALDGIAAKRQLMDGIASQYAAIVTPSVVDEAPAGLHSTGTPVFNRMWTALHSPVVNVPAFQGSSGMPIGISLVSARFRDRHLLRVAREVGKISKPRAGGRAHCSEDGGFQCRNLYR
ncbi:Glutamyl-tRNA(Gln) amidotransferase subunit A [Escovopsis weberi]|uniref:Glutamyl-tRNA(Gln) amidotransferase subunit A n=1 Tax=Escovopsis weberi TaxID=150374 RepID=A0A0M9VWS2_ESCWE|nr:Glutamyl-tRNA(Gln) amidotransferase subunit A [Escovopsis weberi]